MQSITDLRAHCAQLPHSQETFPFDATTLVFKVGPAGAGKMYALTDVQADPVTVSVKVPPERGEELRAAHDAITPGYHLNKRHWVTVTLDGRVPDELIRDLITGSHALVVRGLTRAQRQELSL
ncbi:MmcQ/YjbR family DNA-binding protein [Deinococcus radiotolerans]|uniref:MmcQ-like protein n=1 Tax=Deinococcus radiotolerans TaxID=1309407 RepID=A0ABQ2FHV8_9DEIO|nr:MmcQ/YjbR family DNA-binding protein [Deinococcus radiotolerans]GGK97579.1 MmcQ-like protein [Deinococcus radiotolerans]